MGLVFTKEIGTYEPAVVTSAVRQAVDALGGMSKFVRKGQRVLLKANMLSAVPPEKCVTTHPSVVRAVAGLVIEAGGKPFVGDSPGLDSFSSAARRTGIGAVADELGIPCRELSDPTPIPAGENAAFKHIEVSRLAVESDVVINLPKMKTHMQMVLSLGVKNLFGTVTGMRKAEWHYKVGLRRDRFASLLLDIWRGIGPALTVMDGIIGMEGRGPANGKPRHFGLLAASDNSLSMDLHLCRLLGLPLASFPLWVAAKGRGFEETRMRDADLQGDFVHPYVYPDVDIPRLGSLRLIPRIPLLECALTSRPVQDGTRCTRCGRCVEICPTRAVALRGRDLVFDYKRCIRCYCCHEFCPHDALQFKEGLILKAAKFLRR
jgi:uncharacterized protein (DUF362 family)/ferredoxin